MKYRAKRAIKKKQQQQNNNSRSRKKNSVLREQKSGIFFTGNMVPALGDLFHPVVIYINTILFGCAKETHNNVTYTIFNFLTNEF